MLKLNSFIMSFLVFISFIINADSGSHAKIELKFIKNSDWSLTKDFLCDIASLSGADIFVESGTYLGATVANASPYFKEVHSIELSDSLYKRAVENFLNAKNIFLYNGNSANVLPNIFPLIRGKIVFWLDGHYSEGITAKGDKESPVIEELKAIKSSGLINSIILIDDIRLFGIHPGYPALNEVYSNIKDISALYKTEIMGDILIAFCADESFDVSSVIQACTVSRFGENFYTDDEILNAEQVIASCRGEEKNTFYKLNILLQNRYSLLWYGLICMYEQRYEQAAQNFKMAQSAGINHWRVYWYLGLNAINAKWYDLARQYINVVLEQEPNFEEGLKLIKELEKY